MNKGGRLRPAGRSQTSEGGPVSVCISRRFLLNCGWWRYNCMPGGCGMWDFSKREHWHWHWLQLRGDVFPQALRGRRRFLDQRRILLLHTIHLRYGRPEIVKQDWGDILEVFNPFGNRLRFCQSWFILLNTKGIAIGITPFFIRTKCPLLAQSGRWYLPRSAYFE